MRKVWFPKHFGMWKMQLAQSGLCSRKFLHEHYGKNIPRGKCYPLNPDALNLAEAYFVAAPVIQLGRLDVGVTGHALGDVNIPAAFQVIRKPYGPEGMV